LSIQSDSELDPLGFHFLPQEFCRLASRHSGNLPALTLLLRERHRAPDDASAGSSALSPASVAVSTRRYDHQPHEDDDSLADAVDRRQGGWTTSMEMDRRFCEAFDRITRQVAAVSFLQFIECNCVTAGARAPRQPNGQLRGPQARLHPIQRINEVEGLNLLWQDLRIENASTVVDPVTECMSCPPKELLESYAAL